MSARTPNDAYFKSRRALIVASGLLALSLLSGIAPENTDGSVTVLSFRLTSPENISLILLIVTAYLIWQLWSAWLVQADEVRRSRINRIDVFLSFLISIIAVGIWCWPYLLNAIDLASGRRWNNLGIGVTSGLLIGFLGTSGSYLLLRASTRVKEIMLARRVSEAELKGRESIRLDPHTLIRGEWLLVFNPRTKRSKRLTFLESGAVGEGQNRNEKYWRIADDRLEILNSERKVFSRFVFNPQLSRLEHTNEEDTLSLRDQLIVPAPP